MSAVDCKKYNLFERSVARQCLTSLSKFLSWLMRVCNEDINRKFHDLTDYGDRRGPNILCVMLALADKEK